MTAPTPQQRRAARLIVKIDRHLGQKTKPDILALARTREVADSQPSGPSGR